MSTRNKKKQQDSSKSFRWESQWLETCEKKWLDEEIMKLPQVDMSEGIDQEALDKLCARLLLALKFKSSKWEMFLSDPSKKACNKYKKFEEYVYVRLDRKATEET